MSLTAQVAKQFRDLHYGGNWTWVNVKDSLEGVTWEQATTKIYSLNTIVALVYHMNYYVGAVLKVLKGGPLDASDKYSFAHPTVSSQQDWEQLLGKMWNEAEEFANLIEQLPDSKMDEPFNDGKYGNYYRNITGIIEHTHYHLGQIVVIKKILSQQKQ